jgi:hypothetical protein
MVVTYACRRAEGSMGGFYSSNKTTKFKKLNKKSYKQSYTCNRIHYVGSLKDKVYLI